MEEHGKNMEYCDVCKQKVNCMNNFHYTREDIEKYSSHNMIKYYLSLLFKKKVNIKLCEHCVLLFEINNKSEYNVISLAKRFLEKATKGY